jgi:hypothetical protein
MNYNKNFLIKVTMRVPISPSVRDDRGIERMPYHAKPTV